MNRFYNIPQEAKKRIFAETGRKINLPAFAVEKDWWVVQTLAILFELEIGKHLVFKGGTSLSKGWGIIERFSEDIDLAVDRTFFGFEGVLGKNQRDKLRKAANTYITEILFHDLKSKFASKGLLEVNISLDDITSSDQDPVIINVYYPNVIPSPEYLQPRVQIEIGCRSLFEPFEDRSIISFIDEIYNSAEFSQEAVLIPTVLPERTFLEKMFLLHEEYQRPKEKSRVKRLSRHLYDIYRISKTEYSQKGLGDKELYEIIVKHRNSFTRLGGVNYNSHNPQTINFIPPAESLAEWEKDYNTMQEQMIYGESPNFEDLIKSLEELRKAINGFDWKMDTKF